MNQPQAHRLPSRFSPPRIRHALARWACQQHSLQTTDEIKYKKNSRGELRPDHYHSNRMVRYTHIFSMLRSYTGTSGLIKDWNQQITDIIQYIEISRQTFIATLRQLKEMGWLYYDKFCIKLHSDRVIYEACGLNHFKRNVDRIFTLPQKINNEKRTHYWIYLADISDNRQRQAFVFSEKVMQNPELKLWLYGLLSSKEQNIQEATQDPMRIANLMAAEYRQSFHSKESEMHDWLCNNRPDVNRGVNGMADAWCTIPMNVCYVKKKLAEQLIAFIQKFGTISSPHRSRNKHVHIVIKEGQARPKGVGWNKKDKITFQAFCDDIVPREQPPTDNHLFKNAVAA